MSTKRWTVPLRRRALALVATIGVLLSISIAAPATAAPTASAQGRAFALSGSSFDAGYIIDDANFYQRSAMTQAQIQAFLSSKVTCANSNCLPNLYAKTEARANDRNICLGYTPDSDAKETAATIIYKVQQSCGISARVLLVTLQKEQGLITKSAPTSGQLSAAMGYLCPDTAPCSGQAAGFFRQIYGAAWQMRRYSFPDLWGSYHVGTYSIAYSTSSSCGRKTVKIRNNATAALYNYTPYTPNAGALANLRGTAPCGSYGNRNFWVYYNDWFGSPLAGAGEGAIAAAYAAHGGETGELGIQTSTGACGISARSCSKTYEHGVIVWTTSTGAAVVSGVIGEYYLANGGTRGALGLPVKDAVAVDAGANGTGENQPFTNGFVSSSSAGTFLLSGLYRAKSGDLGGVAGTLGWPTGEKVCDLPKDACQQAFQHGTLFSASSSASVFALTDTRISEYWGNAGGATGALGIPAGDAVDGDAGSVSQNFAGGLVVVSTAGTSVLTGSLRSAYAQRGGVGGPLGWPTGDRACGLAGGYCSQPFQGGTLFASTTASGATIADIDTYHQTKGGGAGPLGVPLKDAVSVSGGANGPGYSQPFSKAFVDSSSFGTFSLTGAIRAAHGKLGGVAGSLGWPVADQVCGLPDGGCSQEFQHGVLYAHGSAAATVTYKPIGDYFAANGGVAALGYPLKEAVRVSGGANGPGYSQPFSKAFVDSSSFGTFSLTGAIRAAHGKLGGVAGSLGWPVADQVCGLPDGGCSQEFQHGVLYAHGSAAATVTYKPIGDYFAANGGVAALGYPLKEAVRVSGGANGPGYSQPFSKAFIDSSVNGTFALVGDIRVAHGKLGGVSGKMGWPVADQVCGLPDSGCSQQFQNGTITADAKGTRLQYRSVQ